MAYGTRFRTEAIGDSGWTYRVDIEEEGYGGSVTDLTPEEDYIEFPGGARGWNGEETHWLRSVVIRVQPDADALSAIFGAGDREFRCSVYRKAPGGSYGAVYFRGFIDTDLYEDNPYLPVDHVELEIVDGLLTLQRDGFDEIASSGTVTVLDAVTGVLETLGLGLDVDVIQDWHPHVGKDWPSGMQPWVGESFQAENYREDREDASSSWWSQYDVLLDILRGFGCTIRQSGGRWHIRQRSAIDNADGTVRRRWRYSESGTPLTSDNDVDLTFDADAAFTDGFTAETRTFEHRVQRVTAVHDHGEYDNAFRNGGYESDDDHWTLTDHDFEGTGVSPDIETLVSDHSSLSNTPDPSQENQSALEIIQWGRGPGAGPIPEEIHVVASQEIALGPRAGRTDQFDISFSGYFDDVTVTDPLLEIRLGGHYLERKTVEVQRSALNASDGSLYVDAIEAAIPEGTTLQIIETVLDEVVSTIRLSQAAAVASYELRGAISEDIDLSEHTNPIEVEYFTLSASQTWINLSPRMSSEWEGHTLRTFARTAAGAPISADSLRIRLAIDVTNDVDTRRFVFDDFQFQILDREGRAIDRSATQVSRPHLGSGRGFNTRLGDGPTATSIARLTAEVGGTTHELLTGWQAGPYGSGDPPSGIGRRELLGRESMRMWRGDGSRHVAHLPLTFYPRVSGTSAAAVPEPHHVVKWDGLRWTIGRRVLSEGRTELFLELVELRDDGTSDLHVTFGAPEEGAGAGGPGSVVIGSQADSARYEVASHFVGRPPAGATLLSWIARHAFTVQDVLVRAETPPASDFDVTVDVGGTAHVVTLPAAAQEVSQAIDELLTAGSLLKVTADSPRDSAVADISLSFDLSV